MRARNIILIGVAAIVVAGAFGLAEYRNREIKKAQYSAPIAALAGDADMEIRNVDSDSDGLNDWEEVILGTNPKNSDSDGDGTTDGKEAEAGRNPLIKGPKDTAEKSSSSLSAPNENLSPTDVMARNFFSKYMELRQVGLSSDEASRQKMVDQVLRSGMVLPTPKIYASSDILVSAEDSPEATRAYGNAVGNIFKQYGITEGKNEAAIAKESLESENYEGLKQIDPIIASYKKILAELFKIQSPQNLASVHLNLINSFSMLVFSAQALRKADLDPLLALQGASIYAETSKRLIESFSVLKNAFVSADIKYHEGEGGSFFIM